MGQGNGNASCKVSTDSTKVIANDGHNAAVITKQTVNTCIIDFFHTFCLNFWFVKYIRCSAIQLLDKNATIACLLIYLPFQNISKNIHEGGGGLNVFARNKGVRQDEGVAIFYSGFSGDSS